MMTESLKDKIFKIIQFYNLGITIKEFENLNMWYLCYRTIYSDEEFVEYYKDRIGAYTISKYYSYKLSESTIGKYISTGYIYVDILKDNKEIMDNLSNKFKLLYGKYFV